MDGSITTCSSTKVALEEKNAALEVPPVHRKRAGVDVRHSHRLRSQRQHRGSQFIPAAFSGKSAGQLERTLSSNSLPMTASGPRLASCFPARPRRGPDAELYLRAGDGSSVPVSVNCTPDIPDRQAHGHGGHRTAGGELRRAYQALRQAHEDEAHAESIAPRGKMVSLGRLVAGVAHELNNPISFVLGNVLSLQRYAGRLESLSRRGPSFVRRRRSRPHALTGRAAHRPHRPRPRP